MTSACDVGYRRTYQLKRGYSVEFELYEGGLIARWLPGFPPPNLARLVHHYRRARIAFLIDALGIPSREVLR